MMANTVIFQKRSGEILISIPRGAEGKTAFAQFQTKYATTKLKAVVTASAN
jgi:hypothetical protein